MVGDYPVGQADPIGVIERCPDITRADMIVVRSI